MKLSDIRQKLVQIIDYAKENNLDFLENWANNELYGYGHASEAALPAYRKCIATITADYTIEALDIKVINGVMPPEFFGANQTLNHVSILNGITNFDDLLKTFDLVFSYPKEFYESFNTSSISLSKLETKTEYITIALMIDEIVRRIEAIHLIMKSDSGKLDPRLLRNKFLITIQ